MLLRDAIASGVSLGFVTPLDESTVRHMAVLWPRSKWQPDTSGGPRRGWRVLVGSAQLNLQQRQQQASAEVQKVCVSRSARNQGIGTHSCGNRDGCPVQRVARCSSLDRAKVASPKELYRKSAISKAASSLATPAPSTERSLRRRSSTGHSPTNLTPYKSLTSRASQRGADRQRWAARVPGGRPLIGDGQVAARTPRRSARRRSASQWAAHRW